MSRLSCQIDEKDQKFAFSKEQKNNHFATIFATSSGNYYQNL